MRTANEDNQKYARFEVIGEGSHATVYRGRNLETGKTVALKQLSHLDIHDPKPCGIPVSAARELFILNQIDHENVIKIIDCFYSPEQITLVFNYYDYDLISFLTTNTNPLTECEIKDILRQIVNGVNCIHENNFIHRDLKSKNILISSNKQIKISDFGLALPYINIRSMTNEIVTLGYRAPELLLGCELYDFSIDMWSVGCIFADLANEGIPLFDATTIDGQLHQMFNLFDIPSPSEWPEFCQLSRSKEYTHKTYEKKIKTFPNIGKLGNKLIYKMLKLNPKQRISSKNAINDIYFSC